MGHTSPNLKNNRNNSVMNKYYKNQTISDNFGINFVDRKSFLDWGMPKVLQKQSKLFIEGEREKIPLAFKRRRDYR